MPRPPAQAESREGIYLQNQILQLRQELDQVRRGGGGAVAPVPRGGTAAPQGELVGALLDRVATLEDETRRLRGRLEQAEFQNRNQSQQLEKLQGDVDYRLQQLEGTGGGPRPRADASAARPAPARPAARPVAAAGRRARRGAGRRRRPPAGEGAVRGPGGARPARLHRRRGSGAGSSGGARHPRAYDARLLLADAEFGQRNWQDAAVAYGEAYKANTKGSRAPEALIGFGTSLANLNQKRGLRRLRPGAERVSAAARGDEGQAGRRPAARRLPLTRTPRAPGAVGGQIRRDGAAGGRESPR